MAKTKPTERTARVDSPESLLAAVPALVGFQSASSIVVIGTGPDKTVRVVLRYDLPDPPDADDAIFIARQTAAVLAGNGIRRVAAVGYGTGVLVTPIADALREHLPPAGITVQELLRVEGQRYWSYVCTDPACHPVDGTQFDPDARLPGLEAAPVLASREALVESVAPVTGAASEAMDRATKRAEIRVAGLFAKSGARKAVAAAGLEAVSEAIGRYRDGGRRLSHDEAAWLALHLASARVRDDAWSRMEPEHYQAHLRLWTNLTRLARTGYVAPPASLLAFVAWQSGNGALANVALDRALAADEHYSMALLLRQAINNGAPPSMARLPMTPEDVAAAYDALDARNE